MLLLMDVELNNKGTMKSFFADTIIATLALDSQSCVQVVFALLDMYTLILSVLEAVVWTVQTPR